MSASIAPLSSSAFLGQAFIGLRDSNASIASSIQRLSSGSRFTSASDDVAALSISTRMQSQLTGLRQASNNIIQGTSMLQMAYDSLTDIGDILDRMLSLSTQANSGSLTTTERGFLQTEFAELTSEIDRIATNTRFNDVNLLDGTLSGQNTITTTTSNATKATASLVFSSIADTNTILLNGSTITAGGAGDFALGGTLEGSIDNLVEYLNTTTDRNLSGATYAKQGSNTLTITYDAGGELGNLYYVDEGNSGATFTTAGTTTAAADVYTLAGGADNGLNAGSVTASGTIGDALVTTQAQTAASTTITFSGLPLNTETITIDDGDGSSIAFTFVASAATDTQITIGSSIEESIENAIAVMEQYSGDDDYGLRNLEFEHDGNTLIIRSRNSGNPLDLNGAALNVGETITNATISATTLNNGTNTGVNTSGVMNEDFVGSITGFTATYNSADNITASITVGDTTYTAEMEDTTPVGATFLRFNSSTGGFFDVQIASSGLSVGDQDDADVFASRLDNAFAGLTFAQNRNVSSFSGSGDLASGSASFQTTDFTTTTPRIRSITVSAPTASDARIEFNINGEIFSAGNIGSTLGAYSSIELVSESDSQKTLTLTMGAVAIDISDASGAADFEEDLRESFGLNASGSGVDIQVGSAATDKLNIHISSVFSSQLFAGATPSIGSQSAAASASTTIQTALNSLGDVMSEVGAMQQRFDYALQNVQSTIGNLDAARATLADTDIVEESTNYATAALRNNAAVAIIAQANQLRSSLLNVLDFG